MKTLILIAVRNLLQNGKRTALLTSAIASVTLLLVIMSSIGNGMYDTILNTATNLTTGHINVAGFFKITSGQAAPVVTQYENVRDTVSSVLPDDAAVVDRLRGWGKVVSPKSSVQVGIGGIDVSAEAGFREVIELSSGSLDGMGDGGGALLFEMQAERLGVQVGDDITIAAPTIRGAQNSVDVRVVAIAQSVGLLSAFNIYVSQEILRELYMLNESSTGALQIYLSDPEGAEELSERVRGALVDAGYEVMDPLEKSFWQKFPIVTREGWTGQRLDVTTWRDELNFLTWTIDAIGALTAVLVGILLVIIVVGVMNALWVAIRERTKEIGTLRAIGMQRGRILLMIVVEAAILSFAGAILGAFAGAATAAGLTAAEIPLHESFQIFLMSDSLKLLVDAPTLIQSVLIIGTITTLFSLFPARRATHMPPITAINDLQ